MTKLDRKLDRKLDLKKTCPEPQTTVHAIPLKRGSTDSILLFWAKSNP
jgi:hypothetical protein